MTDDSVMFFENPPVSALRPAEVAGWRRRRATGAAHRSHSSDSRRCARSPLTRAHRRTRPVPLSPRTE
ncbi:hypothetical protein RR48_11646 [Papilio machaon]|uniref:Uncharacterized protein n=1 Tax=Papilio machaon TaxID=76193 RepID=A0A194R574_PAPMA|nr:hypothetical protein RR48_11646 [Papilio machaon]